MSTYWQSFAKRITCVCCSCAIITLCRGTTAQADSANWNVNAAGNWNTDSNWTAAHPNGIDQVAGLTANISAARIVTLDGPNTIGTLNIGDPTSSFFAYTLSGSSTLTFDVGSGSAAINKSVSTATDVISVPILLNDDLQITTDNGALTISGAIGDGGVGKSLTKLGATAITLSGANTYSGDTIISAGQLTCTTGNSIPDGPGKGNVSIASGATLAVTTVNNERINGLTGLGTLALTNRTFIVGSNNASSTFSGPITSTSATVGTLQKIGTGLTTLDGVAKAMGLVRVNNYGAVLRLDYATTTTDLISATSRLQMSGGTVELFGNSSGPTTQTFADLTMGVNAGHENTIKFTENGGTGIALTLSTGQISRNVGNAVNFDGLSATNTVTTGTAVATTNGLLNAYTANTGGTNSASGYAIVNGSTWATVSGLSIVGLASASYTTSSSLLNSAASYNGLIDVASNIDVNDSATPDGEITVNSLRFDTAGTNALTLQGTNNLNSGGILVTNNVGSNTTTITGGMLVGKAGGLSVPIANFVTAAGVTSVADLIIHQYNANGTLDINSTIVDGAGVTSLTKVGPGVLKLFSNSNSYSGMNYISGGTLQIGGSNVIPHGTGKGGMYLQSTLDLNGFDTTVNAIVVNATGRVTSSVAGPVTFTIGDGDGVGSANVGAIEDGSGVLSLKKIGTGDYAASSLATYSGGTTIEAGSILLSASSAGAAGPLGTGTIILNGGRMTNDAALRSISNTINVVADAVMISNSNSNVLTLNGPITGAGMLDATTAAAQNISYTGDISDFTGTFRVAGSSTNNRVQFIGTTPESLDGSQATFDASSTNATGTSAFRWGVIGNSLMKMGELKGTATTTGVNAFGSVGTSTLEVGHKGTSSAYSGLISETVGTVLNVVKVGGGTLTLGGANTYTGGTSINGGAISVASAGAIGTTGTISFGGGTLQHTATNVIDYSPRFSAEASQAYSVDTNGQTVTYATGLSSSDGSLAKLGAGTLNLTGVNTYSGNTIVDGGGFLALNGGGSISASSGNLNVGDGVVSVANGSSLTVNNTINSAGTGTVHVQAGGSMLSNNLIADFATLDGTATIRADGGTAGTSKVETLTMGVGGLLNLKNNDLVVGTGTLASVRDQIKLGLSGITNTAAAAGITSDMMTVGVHGFGYALGDDVNRSPLIGGPGAGGTLSGQTYDADSVLVKYTYRGDADLDGDSDLDDLGFWANSFTGDLGLGPVAAPTTLWTQGDWDFDGDTDLDDLGFWSSTFTGDLGGGGLSVYAPNASEGAIAALAQMGITAVPEPGSISLLFIGLSAIGLRNARQLKRARVKGAKSKEHKQWRI